MVAPSDNFVPDIKAFHSAVVSGLPEVSKGNIVTFGITPTRPDSGFGYLEISELAGDVPVKIEKFVEKPSVAAATLGFSTNFSIFTGTSPANSLISKYPKPLSGRVGVMPKVTILPFETSGRPLTTAE